MEGLNTELEIAEKIVDGSLPSPVPFGNMWLVNIRITGTGLAYRVGLEEIVWRDPKHYLNDLFLKRCNGLPVVRNHPEDNVLNDAAFKERIVGTVMLPYIKGDEVWCVCRIYSRELVAEIMRGEVSTSPGVVFDSGSGNVEIEGEEDNLLIEGKPYLIDHIAVVTADHGTLGVWDKNQIPEGIDITSIEDFPEMPKENEQLLAKLIKSAVGDALQPINEKVQQLTYRMDSAGIRSDATRDDERRRDDSRNDESEETRRRHESEGEREYHERQSRNARGDKERNDMHRSDESRKDESEETRRRHESEGEREYHERQRRNARGDDSMSEEEIRAAISRLEKKLRREDKDSEDERRGMERYERSRNDLQASDPVHFEKEPKVKEQLNRANENEHGRDEGARRNDAKTDPGLEHERERVGMERYERRRGDAADFDGHHIDVRDDERMSDARSRADAAFRAIGQQAPEPFRGESSLSFRRRALSVMQRYSKLHKSVDVRAINDSAALGVIEEAIYQDAKATVDHEINSTPGRLVPIVRNDAAGRRIIEYKGDVNAWLEAFKAPARLMHKLNTQPNSRS